MNLVNTILASILRFIVYGLFFIILVLALVITIAGMLYIIDVELQLYFNVSFKEIKDAIKNRKMARKERRNKKSKQNVNQDSGLSVD